jgi:hypothetical protein
MFFLRCLDRHMRITKAHSFAYYIRSSEVKEQTARPSAAEIAELIELALLVLSAAAERATAIKPASSQPLSVSGRIVS